MDPPQKEHPVPQSKKPEETCPDKQAVERLVNQQLPAKPSSGRVVGREPPNAIRANFSSSYYSFPFEPPRDSVHHGINPPKVSMPNPQFQPPSATVHPNYFNPRNPLRTGSSSNQHSRNYRHSANSGPSSVQPSYQGYSSNHHYDAYSAPHGPLPNGMVVPGYLYAPPTYSTGRHCSSFRPPIPPPNTSSETSHAIINHQIAQDTPQANSTRPDQTHILAAIRALSRGYKKEEFLQLVKDVLDGGEEGKDQDLTDEWEEVTNSDEEW